ncbi:hypothetical protein AMJ80_05610 [bacterium SM23_31]|nr:MAG: hypothetical protein AMJ80_05610 [bacterium SM23_31]
MDADNLQSLRAQIMKQLGDSTPIFEESRERYIIGDKKPDLVVTPSDAHQIASIMESAHSSRAAVIPWGGGTNITTGNLPEHYDIALDVRKLNLLKEYEPAEFLVIAGAGMTLSKLNEALAEHNQFLPLNPPHPEKTTIGGILASNAYGYLRDTYGAARDMTLGLRFVRADGTHVKGGGKVAKNVAGYDLTRLLIGSWGTLGIITEAALRIHPVPEKQTTILAGFENLSSTVDAAFEMQNSYFAPTFIVVLNRTLAGKIAAQINMDIENGAYMFVIGVDELEETVSWQVDNIKTVCQKNHVFICDVIPGDIALQVRNNLRDYPSAEYTGVVCKIAATKTGVVNLLNFLHDLKSRTGFSVEILTYFGSGIVYVLMPFPSDIDDLFKNEAVEFVKNLRLFAEEDSGFCTLEHAPVWLKKPRLLRVWPTFPGETIMKKLKKQFDSNNVLNPERFIRQT